MCFDTEKDTIIDNDEKFQLFQCKNDKSGVSRMDPMHRELATAVFSVAKYILIDDNLKTSLILSKKPVKWFCGFER